MIKTWTLQYFKSVYEKTTLEFGPLTIFSGANSSGKTTIIQSLLLTAQTLQNSVSDRPIILNGHIIKAGSFNDIVSNGHEQENILIGFELSSDFDNVETSVSNFTSPIYTRSTRNFLTRINCEFQFSAKKSNENTEPIQLQPLLEECKIEAISSLKYRSKEDQNSQNYTEEIHLQKTNQSLEERLKEHHLQKENLQNRELSSLAYEVKNAKELKSNFRRISYRNLPATANFIGASLNQFLPDRLSIVFDATEEEADQLVESLISFDDDDFLSLQEEDDDFLLNEVKDIMIEIIQESINHFTFTARRRPKKEFLINFAVLKQEFSIGNLFNCYQSLSTNDKRILAEKLHNQKNELKNAIKSNKPPEYAVVYVQLPQILDVTVDYIKKFFTNFVKYLGPIRDEPKTVYSSPGTTYSKDIGVRGEHTAAVLEIHRQTKVKYIPSEQFELGNSTPEIVEKPLSTAVLDWLKYMGIANEVKTFDKGVLGYQLKVAISETQSLHDLTHVGVGVSQVIPVLVQSLLAERGSTLIFEQPELHLHPKIQTRLADFFISMTMLNKQCIVETHSEYLINRLRYLSANSQDDKISKDVVIYFVEKQGEKSHYRHVKINEFGVIEGWPKGFFDESEQNSRSIIKAAMEKRKTTLQKK